MAQVGQTSNGYTLNVNSSAANHLMLLKNGSSLELKNLQNGDAFTAQRSNAQISNTEDINGNSHFLGSNSVAGTATVSVIPGSFEDKLFLQMYDEQKDAFQNGNFDGVFFTLKGIKGLEGKNAVCEGCLVTQLPEDGIRNSINPIGYQIQVADYHIDHDKPQASVLK